MIRHMDSPDKGIASPDCIKTLFSFTDMIAIRNVGNAADASASGGEQICRG